MSSPIGLLASPVEHLFSDGTQEKFWKFDILPGESSRPHRGTETVRKCVKEYVHQKRSD